MVFCLEHPKRDQNPKFRPLSDEHPHPFHMLVLPPPPGPAHVLV